MTALAQMREQVERAEAVRSEEAFAGALVDQIAADKLTAAEREIERLREALGIAADLVDLYSPGSAGNAAVAAALRSLLSKLGGQS